MDISKMSLNSLKARAYDEIKRNSKATKNLEILEKKIGEMEKLMPPTKKEMMDELCWEEGVNNVDLV